MSSAGQPGLISLAVGWPSPRLYPTDELARITADVFAEEGGEALSLPARRGPVRAARAARRARPRASASPTTPRRSSSPRAPSRGSASPRARRSSRATWRWWSRPRSSGMLDSLRQTGARVIGVPVDEDGFDVGQLERLLARHEVKLVRAPDAPARTPPAATSPRSAAQRLAELAMERNFFVLEDRVYADARFDGEPPASIRELAPAHVIYVNSLSKVVGGGLRVGWVAARGPVRERIAMLKLESDFHSATLIQHIAARWLATGAYDRHVEHTQALLPRAARRAARGARAPHARRVPGRSAARRPPRVGHARRARSTSARSTPRRRATAWRSRRATRSRPSAASQTSFRLSFSLLDPPELDEGVRRLARAIREVRRRSRRAVSAPHVLRSEPRASARARRACAARRARSGSGTPGARRRGASSAPRRTRAGPRA